MKQYFIYSVIQPNYLQHLKNLIKSMKHFKQKNVKYNYIVAIDDQNIESYKQDLDHFNSEDFELTLYSSIVYKSRINSFSKTSYIYYVRCLLPTILSGLDKILFLDVDTLIIKSGLEQFYDQDISYYYVAACWDQMNFDDSPDSQKSLNKIKTYFNAGIMLLNIKKIKKDGKDKELERYLLKWPENLKKSPLPDQTLLNYVFRNKVFYCSPKWNNTISMINTFSKYNYYQSYKIFNYSNPEDSLKDTVILHFAGPKPWNEMNQKDKQIYFLFPVIKKIYEKILQNL